MWKTSAAAFVLITSTAVIPAAHAQAPTAGISRDRWVWHGPANLGGRVNTLAIRPGTPRRILLGTQGGIWSSTDEGATWSAVDDWLPSLSIAAIHVNPTNPDILYAASGEYDPVQAFTVGAGILKSTDGGVSWQQLAATADWSATALAISPDGGVILAAAVTATYRGSALYRSMDAGVSWEQVTPGGWKAMTLAFHPTDPGRAIAGATDGSIWSTSDGGATWSAAVPAVPVDPLPPTCIHYTCFPVAVAYARSDPTVAFAVRPGALLKSTDAGLTFAIVDTGTAPIDIEPAHAMLWIHPLDSNTIVLGGRDLWRSTDGGATLTAITAAVGPTGLAAFGQRAVVESPSFGCGTDASVWVATDREVLRTGDILSASTVSGWTDRTAGLGIAEFETGAGTLTDGVAAGLRDNALARFASGAEWTRASTWRPVGAIVVDRARPNRLYAADPVYLYRSSDAGSSWSQTTVPGSFQWRPMALAPDNGDVLFLGSQSVERTLDATAESPAWQSVNSQPRDPLNRPVLPSALAAADGGDTVWVAHNTGDVSKTMNGLSAAPQWAITIDEHWRSWRFVSRVVIDPQQPNTV